MEQQLIKTIAALPDTAVSPYTFGGGVQITHQISSGACHSYNVWTGRKSTVQRLQEYLQWRRDSALAHQARRRIDNDGASPQDLAHIVGEGDDACVSTPITQA